MRKGIRPKADSVVLPFKVKESKNYRAALHLIDQIYGPVEAGEQTLKRGLEIVLSQSDHAVSAQAWPELIKSFRRHLIENKNKIKASTYRGSYERYLDVALLLIQSRDAPTTGFELLDRVLHHQRFNQKKGTKQGEPLVKWNDQPSSRRECCLAIRNLMDFAVYRHHQAQSWLINPLDYAELRGSTERKRKKATLTDEEFLGLVDALEKRGSGWANVIKLSRVYGLRMWEINHLVVTTNPSGEKQLFCSKGKVSATHGRKHENEPRFLFPIDVNGQDFDLQGQIERGQLELPIGVDGQNIEINGRNLGNRLRALSYWKELLQAKERCGEWLRPYSFRDTYSIRATELGIHDSLTSVAMGHTPEVHRRSYRTGDFQLTADAFKRTRGKI